MLCLYAIPSEWTLQAKAVEVSWTSFCMMLRDLKCQMSSSEANNQRLLLEDKLWLVAVPCITTCLFAFSVPSLCPNLAWSPTFLQWHTLEVSANSGFSVSLTSRPGNIKLHQVIATKITASYLSISFYDAIISPRNRDTRSYGLFTKAVVARNFGEMSGLHLSIESYKSIVSRWSSNWSQLRLSALELDAMRFQLQRRMCCTRRELLFHDFGQGEVELKAMRFCRFELDWRKTTSISQMLSWWMCK